MPTIGFVHLLLGKSQRVKQTSMRCLLHPFFTLSLFIYLNSVSVILSDPLADQISHLCRADLGYLFLLLLLRHDVDRPVAIL